MPRSGAGIDPYLVAAVVREESSYYPRAISRAGARGLMQLMPARRSPGRGAWMVVRAATSTIPAFNIELGTPIPRAVSCASSTIRGWRWPPTTPDPRRVRQWSQARRSDDIEAFVEQIPFDETRLYVKRVMLSWEEYRRIYGSP